MRRVRTGRPTDAGAALVISILVLFYKPVRAGSSQESNDLNLSELDENNLPTWKLFDATHAGPTLVVSPVRSPSDPPRDPPQQRPDQNYNVFFNTRILGDTKLPNDIRGTPGGVSLMVERYGNSVF